MGVELFHADRRTDMTLVVAICNGDSAQDTCLHVIHFKF